jgi:hypothetical protein
MLPYTPLHVLLCEEMDTLVMTSANLSEEPICIGMEEASQRLADIADAFLHHNRDILQRCDDSVYRVIDEQPQPVRRSRGYVPRPILLDDNGPVVLAVGAELKNTICLASGRSAVLSQHIGDLEQLETLRFLEECVRHLTAVFQAEPEVLAHDMHPGYLGTQWATGLMDPALRERFAQLPRLPVQHHHAHLAACLAEHRHAGPALGIILDGTAMDMTAKVGAGNSSSAMHTPCNVWAAFVRCACPARTRPFANRGAWPGRPCSTAAWIPSGMRPHLPSASTNSSATPCASRWPPMSTLRGAAVAAVFSMRWRHSWDCATFCPSRRRPPSNSNTARRHTRESLEYDIDEGRGTAFELSFLPTVWTLQNCGATAIRPGKCPRVFTRQ